MATLKRTVAYIDGFNFYNGLLEKGFGKYRWIDLYSLCQKVLPADHGLELVRYFTSRVRGDIDKHNRQQGYVLALETQIGKGIKVEYGRFQLFPSHCKHCKASPVYCENCKKEYSKANEKKTDVNIATMMMVDCIEDKTDCLMLISGDSDYETTFVELGRLFPKVRRVIAFPPKRRNPRMYSCCDEYFDIERDAIVASQLPDPVANPANGKRYSKPPEWG